MGFDVFWFCHFNQARPITAPVTRHDWTRPITAPPSQQMMTRPFTAPDSHQNRTFHNLRQSAEIPNTTTFIDWFPPRPKFKQYNFPSSFYRW